MGRDTLGPRPRDFYGPEDWYDGMDVEYEMYQIAEDQREWDQARKNLPWYRRIFT